MVETGCSDGAAACASNQTSRFCDGTEAHTRPSGADAIALGAAPTGHVFRSAPAGE
ncbi:MAG: hypothetical protein PGN13_14690 [Patulibacter minatonensis]